MSPAKKSSVNYKLLEKCVLCGHRCGVNEFLMGASNLPTMDVGGLSLILSLGLI